MSNIFVVHLLKRFGLMVTTGIMENRWRYWRLKEFWWQNSNPVDLAVDSYRGLRPE